MTYMTEYPAHAQILDRKKKESETVMKSIPIPTDMYSYSTERKVRVATTCRVIIFLPFSWYSRANVPAIGLTMRDSYGGVK